MKQNQALNILKSGDNVFITGSAGTGKTYLLSQFIQYLKERRIYPTIVAPTGIAASHLKGQTIHSFFALGIRDSVVDDEYVEHLLQKKHLKSRFDKVQILIIDEVSMVSPEIFESMDKILRGFKDFTQPFGGVQVVISGDFFQLPPVSKEPKVKRFAWQAPSWKALELKSSYLQEKFRQADNQLITILDEIRNNAVSIASHALLQSCMNREFNTSFTPTKLYTHNIDVDRINLQELYELEGQIKEFKYSSKGSSKNVEKIFKSSLVLEVLQLKKDAVVMFIKNNPEKGYLNGTTGVVVGFEGLSPIVRTTLGTRIYVAPEEWSLENAFGEKVASVSQLPLRLAWAITIHKSQGMTLDCAQIDLSKTFEVGQGYVALSRVKSIDGLKLMGLNEKAFAVEPLSLRIDEPIKKASIRATNEIEQYNEAQLQRIHLEYIEYLGGLTSLEAIEEEKKQLQNPKAIKAKIPTHLQTKGLIPLFTTIHEIAKAREMTEGTIINHLAKLKEEDSNLNLNKFKPEPEICHPIEEAIEKLEKENNEEHFSDDGTLRLKPIHEALGGEVSYDTIRLVMLFR
jgi:hypothetical protein